MRTLKLVVFVDLVTMAIENESKINEDLGLCSVCVRHMIETRVAMSRERKLDWFSKARPMVLLHKNRSRVYTSTKCRQGWGTTQRHSTIGQTALCLHLPSLPTAASLHSLLLVFRAGQQCQLGLSSPY